MIAVTGTKIESEHVILKPKIELFGSVIVNIEQQLIQRLQDLSPLHLEVVNESSGHGGYFPGKESHFKVIVVSDIFQGLRLVQRHQKSMRRLGTC